MSQIELLLSLLVASITCVTSQVPGGYYQTKYENLDVDDVLNHKRLVHHYAACLLNRGPCPPQGADLKRILPEALQNTCLRCTEKQKYIVYRTITRLKNEYASLWREIVDFYDPTQENITRFEQLFDKGTTPDAAQQQNDLLFNRFSDDGSQNEVTPPAKPSTMRYPEVTPSKPSSSTTITSTTSTTSTSTSTTTTTTSTTKRPPSTMFASTFITKLTASTTTPSPPIRIYFRPLDLNFLKNRILGDFSKVIQAGTEVAGMVLQAFTGQNM